MTKANCILQEKCNKLVPESHWLKENEELNMKFYYKDELHLTEGYQKFANSISKIISRQYKTETPSYKHAVLKNTTNAKIIKNSNVTGNKELLQQQQNCYNSAADSGGVE